MGPDVWRSFTDPPFLGEEPPSRTEQTIREITGQASTAAREILTAQAQARQAEALARIQGNIEIEKVRAEGRRAVAEAQAAGAAVAAGRPLPVLGGGREASDVGDPGRHRGRRPLPPLRALQEAPVA